MIASIVLHFLLGAITLDGVTGVQLTARSFLDSNNVRVGDPMTLSIDFVGTAELENIHPPAISKVVDASTWKLDDRSAKTDTADNGIARRLIYRVRPLREGVLEFPALSFSYQMPDGTPCTISTRPLPVRVKPAAQAALAGLEDMDKGLPMPDGIIISLSEQVSEDELFRWKKACRTPTSDSFSRFTYPEARLNEASALILEGQWAKAMGIYSSLEWRIGQTPAIERGIVAALARKYDNAAVELPAWRQTLRPLLRFGWKGRVLWTVLTIAVLGLVFWLCGRAIRAMACLAILLLPLVGAAQGIMDPFAEMDRMIQQAFGTVQSTMRTQRTAVQSVGGGFPMVMTFNGQQQAEVKVKASVRLSKTNLQVGDPFEFIIALETPKSHTVENIQLRASDIPGLVVLGAQQNLSNGVSTNPSNVVRRLSVPVRVDAPFDGHVSFAVDGMISGRIETGSGRMKSTFTFSNSFAETANPVKLVVKPLPTQSQPADFTGVVGSNYRLRLSVDRNQVETNDVVVVTCVLEGRGYVPMGAVPDELARTPGRIVWRKYFVADGSPSVPDETFSYYDTATREYLRVTGKGPKLYYVACSDETTESVAVDTKGTQTGVVKLRFAPWADAQELCTVQVSEASFQTLETYRDWVRVDDGHHAGWLRKEELPK